jgi:hypothetical protein
MQPLAVDLGCCYDNSVRWKGSEVAPNSASHPGFKGAESAPASDIFHKVWYTNRIIDVNEKITAL